MAAITVGDLQGALPAGTTLLGGRAGLSRPVSGTATFRARTPAFPALHGGEVALVSLALLRQVDPSAALDRLVTQLAGAGVAAVILLDAGQTAGEDAGAALSAAARAADERGLSVFAATGPVTADEIELGLHRHLAGQRETLLRRSQELQQEFTQLALAGNGMTTIVQRLAAVTGLPAAWEVPAALEPIVWAAPPASGGAEWRPPAELSRAATDLPGLLRAARLPLQRWHASAKPGASDYPSDVTVLPLRADAEGGSSAWRRLVVGVRAGAPGAGSTGAARTAGETAGYLSVIAPETGSAEIRLALGAAGLAASIDMLRARTVREAQGSAVASLVHDWLAGRLSDGEMAARAAQPGLTLVAPFAVLVVETERPLGAAEIATIEACVSGLDAAPGGGSAAVGVRVGSGGPPAPPLSVGLDGGRTVLIVSNATEAALESAAAKLHSAFTRRDVVGAPDAPIFAGIGRAALRAEDVPRAYGEAVQSLAVARRLGGRHRVAFYGTLGVYRVLAATEQGELAGFRHETLGPLLRADERTGGELLRTLETYLLCGGSPQETALRLHTHRNTVLYRLQRIGEALGVDVRAPEVQLTLWLAVRAGDVLGVPESEGAGRAGRGARTAKQAVA